MIPAALSTMLEQGVADFLRMSFWSSTPGMEEVIERFVRTEGAVFKGPYVTVKLPFRRGRDEEFFPHVPLGFPAHLHQELAFARLGSAAPKSTLVGTGTGSGKTESFLMPILDYCRRHTGTPGVKAILIYPMNALATDQARRIAELCSSIPALEGVKAGLYIGESEGQKSVAHRAMGADHVITDRARMQRDPPDILLTNYRMLDYLLVRPADQEMWVPSRSNPVRFLVVDELHSFDGAQGTDLACLIRRLKARLGVARGALCCVGTSATLGSPDAESALRAYAEQIFGEPFDAGSIIGEARQPPEEFFAGKLIEGFKVPGAQDLARLDPSAYASPREFILAQQALWFEDAIDAQPGSDAWRVALGDRLLTHAVLRNLVLLLADKPVAITELAESLARTSRPLRENPELARRSVVSFLSLISEARSWLPERARAQGEREQAGRPRRTRPLLEVRLQLWQRELRRMVGDLGDPASGQPPALRYSDDLTDEQRGQHLPVIHCRDCGAMGWASCVSRDRPDLFGVGFDRFYRAFFAGDPQVRFLWLAQAAEGRDARAFERFHIDRRTLARVRDELTKDAIEVVRSDSTHTVSGRHELHRNCPFCGARESLALVGFRAATLTSMFIDQLFTSAFNDDKKLLAFSDSVQDAAHRAGFFGARTWSFNLRVAIQKVVANAEGRTLAELPALFMRAFRRAATPEGEPVPESAMDDVAFVSTFLAPNMEWFSEYEAMLGDGEIPSGSSLVHDVERRIAYEIPNEYGLQSRIGRSLPRTGCSTVAIDPVLLDAATDALLDRLRNEVAGLRGLERKTLRAFLLGALHHLREVGGIHHPELPSRFVESAGSDDYVFKQTRYLPSFGPRSRFATLLTTDPRSRRFDIIYEGGASGFYEHWVARTLGDQAPLVGEASEVWAVVLPVLVAKGLLRETGGIRGKVWGIAPEALRLTNHCVPLRCPRCRHWLIAAGSEAAELRGAPCLSPPCAGTYADDPAAELPNYFGRLIARGHVERVFPEEHTGLLDRPQRELIEAQFKAEERKPWYPNLLSCTPTLEMGIDIGTLSAAILCSVPPAQANYLQRIGRAGRRDGNALVLTIAQARPHDLYFYAQPTEMIAGDVQPPGVFLNASAVLERQLAAFGLDQWNSAPGQHRFSPRLREVFAHLDPPSQEHFPHNWLSFVRREQERLLREFVRLFDTSDGRSVLTEASQQHLREFLLGDDHREGSLSWKVIDALSREKKALDSIRRKARRLKDQIKELKAAVARDKDHDERIAEHEREQIAHEKLARAIDSTLTLEFLTNEGLLPNYAFPEAPVRLRSIIWRRKARPDGDGRAYETKTYEYSRPPVAALGEFAPTAQFYAGGRRVAIDQVDVDAAEIEVWRFCNACSYCVRVDQSEPAPDCPSCGSPGFGEESQRRQLLRLQQVFARTSDRDSRIRDDVEERQPRFFNRDMLPSFRDQDRQGAWKLDSKSVPFAFEYYRRASFREINFGELSDDGTRFSIAGQSAARQGFVICKRCGKVQPKRGAQQRLGNDVRGAHTLWCSARQRGEREDDFEAAVYLYREYASEAVRLLLPLADHGAQERLPSFLAAFQLGLKDRYGGRVEHLQTLVYSEPERDSLLRRQYLVLYDAVPGGTGYLKDIVREPAPGEAHALIDILRRARDRIATCECFGDPARDGCYRCLFAYRNSRDMSETSARAAMQVLTEILDEAGKLVRTESLTDIRVSGLMDSVLEARFVEALQRFPRADRKVTVQKRLVRNRAGYQLSVGAQEWLIEPQVELGAAAGLAVNVSIDFVLRPATVTAGRRPIAVFLDGFQYHQARVGDDMLQRMSLLTSGEYDVWSFTWEDVKAAFERDTALPRMLLHPDGPMLKQWYRQLGLGGWSHVLDTTPLELLLQSLASPEDPVPWSRLGAIALIAQMGTAEKADLTALENEIVAAVPAPFASCFEIDPQRLYARRLAEGPGSFSLWATTTRAAAQDVTRVDDFRAVLWLDDARERHNTEEYREAWRAFLYAFMFLRTLPHVLFVTRTGSRHADGYARLAQLRSAPSGATTSGWSGLDVSPEFEPLIAQLAAADVVRPEVGLDLPDKRGLSSGIEGELVWEEQRVAVVRTLGRDDEIRIASNWKIFTLAECAADVAPLVRALSGAVHGGHS